MEIKHNHSSSGEYLYCPFCKKYSKEFLPFGLDIPVLKEKNVVGGGYRLNAMCPHCHSIDRERLIYLYLKNKKADLFSLDKKFKLLHIAPEENLQNVLIAQPNIEYLSADLTSPLAAVRMDITDIKFKDNYFDVIICNHVLEHIPDDRKAMTELYRVLKPGGFAILQVPIALALDQTYEDPSITSPEEREKMFGQSDHVRLYARDYRDRLEKVGFSVEQYSFANEFGESVLHQYGLSKEESIYICSKSGCSDEFKNNQEVECNEDNIYLNRSQASYPIEEEISYYKKLPITPVGISKDKVPNKLDANMSDAELVAFYSERYVDIDPADSLTEEHRKIFYGLCNVVKPAEFYLHAGCVDGTLMEMLYQNSINGIGLDLAISNILRGRTKYPHLKFIHGFAEEIPFKDNYFDIVILGDVIEHFRNLKVTLAECLRVASKGLILYVSVKQEITEEQINPLSCEAIINLLEFYKLKVQFYDIEGKEICQDEAKASLKTFPWLLIRSEKTDQTNTAVKNIIDTEGKQEHKRVVEEIIRTDQWCYDTEHQRDETHLSRFKLLSHLIEGQNVLELGCGNGDLAIEIAKLGFYVVGVDISEPGIKQAIELANKEHVDVKTKFIVMDATNLHFPDNSFDTILIPELIEHTRSSRKILEEAIRVVRNGGRIIISVPDGLCVPFPGHLRVFFKDTLSTELSQYTKEITWHELPFKKWLICSFFIKKPNMNITEGPLIDILMPTYNGRNNIRRTIKSVIDQTYHNWNLVVVNDGGEDVKDILDEFNDSRIKYIVTEHKGKAHALNVGIKNSSGEFIGYLDDDDILYPIHLEVLIKTVLENKKDFVYSDWYEVSVNENNKEIGREFQYRLDVAPWMLIPQNYINHKCILHSRSLLQKVGLYDESLDILIDWDMIRRLAFTSTPYHIWSVTSEHIMYYKQNILVNRITGLWQREPHKAKISQQRIIDKTVELNATHQDLKEAIVNLICLYYRPMLDAKEQSENLLRQKNEELENEVVSLRQQRTELQDKMSGLESELIAVRQKNEELENELVSLYLSNSWRITKPLRWIRRKLKI